MDDVKTSLAELDSGLRQRVRTAIGLCRKKGEMVKLQHGEGTEVYAYPRGENETHWGVNGGPNGFCIARGIE